MILDKYLMHNGTALHHHLCDPTWLSRMELSFFVRRYWIIIWICVALVLASWSLSSDKLELNCVIGMVDGFNLLKWSIATPYMTCSSPRYPVRYHSLVCSDNSFKIVWIRPICDKELYFIFRSDQSDGMCVYS